MMTLRSLTFGANLAFASLAVAVLAAQPASAQAPPFGPDCQQVMARTHGTVWVGTIRGQREDMWDSVETRFQRSCFQSRAACEKWLYDARSYYTLNFDNDLCRPAQPRR